MLLIALSLICSWCEVKTIITNILGVFITFEKDISLIKPPLTEHQAIHVLEIDESYWKVRTRRCSPASYFLAINKGTIVSRPFTADDDGEVFWKIRLERDETDKTMFKFFIDMVLKPNNKDVLWAGGYKINNALVPICVQDSFYEGLVTSPSQLGCNGTPPLLKVGFDLLTVGVRYAKVQKFEDVTSLITPISGVSFNHQRNEVPIYEGRQSVATEIASLLKNQTVSDVIIKAQDKDEVWKLHKCILSARSSVFAAMFNNDMLENNKGVVEILEDVKALDLMFKFIYYDDIDATDMRDEAEKLIFLADKYDLPELKYKCEVCLISQITVENCLRLFAAADMLNAQLLRKSAKHGVSRNVLVLYETDEYKEFMSKNCELAIEITADVAMQRNTYENYYVMLGGGV